jgi:Family of unknown function (DUF6518)
LRMVPWVFRAGSVALLLGAVLGFVAQLSDNLVPQLHRATSLGVPWLVAAFAVGALWRDRAVGARAGATALVTGTVVYYILRILGWGTLDATLPIAVGWCLAAAGGGALFGAAGAAWRGGDARMRAGAAALVGGALIGEAVLLSTLWSGEGARLVLGAELVAGALLPFALARRAVVAALALAVVVAVVVFVGEHGVREALRGTGWNGA